MKKIFSLALLLTGFLLISCNNKNATNTNNENKTENVLEQNRKNDSLVEVDHVHEASELPVLTPEQKQAYINKSKKAAKAAFDIFSGHLNRLFKEKHPAEALTYCHDNALKITDSLSKAYGIKIKRTSYRLRNPKNKPTEQEEKVMEIFRQQILKNLKPKPYMHYDVYGNPHVYIPIMVQEKCLMCHGDPNKDIPEVINQKLAELYPGDKAIFFKKGDLRGIWSMTFPKNHPEKADN